MGKKQMEYRNQTNKSHRRNRRVTKNNNAIHLCLPI